MLKIVKFRDDLAPLFHDINAEWINGMFEMEEVDRHVLEHPRETIIDKGGVILFVDVEGRGIVGAGALKWSEPGQLELTKMGVRSDLRGLKAGEFLLQALIERAATMAPDRLYLLTNKQCEAAIHLYAKCGFEHDAELLAEARHHYARCDVAMTYRG
ncbi:MAG: GNAT family N-acetyltransferase [Sphingomonadaceae bacterium]|nr:GNAT family N-acetyltransferase [Sphingomonadaceae bacterium]